VPAADRGGLETSASAERRVIDVDPKIRDGVPGAVPAPSSGVAVPAPSSGVAVPAPSSSVAVPAPSSGVAVPAPSSGVAVPAPSSGAAGRRAAPGGGRLIDYLTLALLTLIWSTTWAAIRIGLRGIPPFTGVALRFGIGAGALLALARPLGVRFGRGGAGRAGGRLAGSAGSAGSAGREAAPVSPWRVWLFNGVLTFFLAYGVLYWAEQWVPSGLASVLFATSPLWVALAAHVALPGERLTGATVAGVAIGFGGVALIFSDDLRALGGPHVAGAAALLLISPLASAIGVVGVKRWGAGIHPLSTAAVPMALTAGAMGCVALAVEHGRAVTFDLASVGALLYLALCGSALAFTLYFWLLGRLPATTLSLINYMTPVLALWIGSAALHETVTPRTLGGSALVVGGVAVALRARQPRRRA
jgi:drug/metabolite transporter (DMT)-like permease